MPLLITLAADLKLSPVELRDALASGTFAAKVRDDFISSVRSGVNGTPSFFVNGVRHDSSYGVATLASAIDQAILAAARDRRSWRKQHRHGRHPLHQQSLRCWRVG